MDNSENSNGHPRFAKISGVKVNSQAEDTDLGITDTTVTTTERMHSSYINSFEFFRFLYFRIFNSTFRTKKNRIFVYFICFRSPDLLT